LKGHLFIAPGDLTQLSAHAIAYSASNALGRDGNLYSAFAANVPGFADWYARLPRRPKQLHDVGDAGRMPRGVFTVVSARFKRDHLPMSGSCSPSSKTSTRSGNRSAASRA
jgi:hypothetical protein